VSFHAFSNVSLLVTISNPPSWKVFSLTRNCCFSSLSLLAWIFSPICSFSLSLSLVLSPSFNFNFHFCSSQLLYIHYRQATCCWLPLLTPRHKISMQKLSLCLPFPLGWLLLLLFSVYEHIAAHESGSVTIFVIHSRELSNLWALKLHPELSHNFRVCWPSHTYLWGSSFVLKV